MKQHLEELLARALARAVASGDLQLAEVPVPYLEVPRERRLRMDGR